MKPNFNSLVLLHTPDTASSFQKDVIMLAACFRRAQRVFQTSLNSGLFLLVSAIFTVSATSNTQAALITSFEESEGFELGTLSGQEGWSGGGAWFNVSNAQAKDGVWSLAVSPGVSRVDSPDLLSSGFTSISYWVLAGSTPSAQYSRVRVLLGDSENANHAALQFYIRREGTGYQIQYTSWIGDAPSTTWATLASFSPTNWNEVSVNFASESKTYSLSVNGDLLASGISLPTAVTTSDAISRIEFWNIASGTFSGTTYYDTVTAAVPEPTTSALLLTFIVATAFRLRSKSKKN